MDVPAVPAPGADPVAESIDGATGDWSVSGDAMRWSPALAERATDGPPGSAPMAGPDVATGLGAVLALDAVGMRRLVGGALTNLGVAASDVVSDLRQLTRGPSVPDDDR